MTPSVPSEPTNSWVRSGPTAARGAPPVCTVVPSASTTSSPTTMSSILPYRVDSWPAPRHASHPPTVDSAIDCGQWPGGHVVVGAELVFEARRRTSPAARRRSSTWCRRRRCPTGPVRSSSTPPNTGTLAPHTPLRPAAAVTGTREPLHTASTSATSSALVGRTTTPRARGDLVVERPDHRERPPVAARLARSCRRRPTRRRTRRATGRAPCRRSRPAAR